MMITPDEQLTRLRDAVRAWHATVEEVGLELAASPVPEGARVVDVEAWGPRLERFDGALRDALTELLSFHVGAALSSSLGDGPSAGELKRRGLEVVGQTMSAWTIGAEARLIAESPEPFLALLAAGGIERPEDVASLDDWELRFLWRLSLRLFDVVRDGGTSDPETLAGIGFLGEVILEEQGRRAAEATAGG